MLRDEPPHRLHTISAEDIMATDVKGFKSIETVARILEILRNRTHNGFPVFAIDDVEEKAPHEKVRPGKRQVAGRMVNYERFCRNVVAILFFGLWVVLC